MGKRTDALDARVAQLEALVDELLQRQAASPSVQYVYSPPQRQGSDTWGGPNPWWVECVSSYSSYDVSEDCWGHGVYL